MTPILQTKFGNDGNCLAACIASLLEIDIDSVPNPHSENWQNELNEWLVENHGIYILTVGFFDKEIVPVALLSGYIIGVGLSFNNRKHAVLCRNGKVVHDPLPYSGLTYDLIEEFDLLIKYFKEEEEE